jgi:uncharacterized glyoxalase superfamily protein PhnB
METKRKKIKTVPDQYTAITPWVISSSTAELIKFLEDAFEAKEVPGSRIKNEDGAIIHDVVKIGDALIMLFDAKPDWAPTPAFLNLYVDDAEKVYQKALKLGATSVTDMTTLYFGEKVCRIIDPFGNLWWINERVEEVDLTDTKEMGKRASTPEAQAGIAYIQRSLNDALLAQKSFFEYQH